MDIEYVPVLAIHRELQGIPRGMERFRAYLRTVLNDAGDDAELPPLVAVNPMGREHVTDLLDRLLAFDADAVAARASAEAGARLADVPGTFRASLAVLDDARGGWTSRPACDWQAFNPDPAARRFWITGVLWSSEGSSERAAREAILVPIYRAAHAIRHGPARTLRDLLAREGWARREAGCEGPVLDPEELEYTRAVLEPHLDAEGMRPAVEFLCGDPAARSLGFTPRGLSPDAGLALALHDARAAATKA